APWPDGASNATYCGPTTRERCVVRKNREFLRTRQRSVGEAPHSTAFGGGGSAQHSVRWGRLRTAQRSVEEGSENAAFGPVEVRQIRVRRCDCPAVARNELRVVQP